MREIAYKLSQNCPSVADALPADVVVEWTYLDLHPPGTISRDEWQFANEDEFQPILQNSNRVLGI